MNNEEINEIKEWITAHMPIEHDGSYVPISEVIRLLILRGNEIFKELEENDYFLEDIVCDDGWYREGYMKLDKIKAFKKKYGLVD
jgi:disulfide oxidoreductase YuzD